jgi:hypothetical protein
MACFDVKISSTTGKIDRDETLKNTPSFTTFLEEQPAKAAKTPR